MRPPVKSIFKARNWVDRAHCGFGGPVCYTQPDPGQRFCAEHRELFARIRAELERNPRAIHMHQAGWEQAA